MAHRVPKVRCRKATKAAQQERVHTHDVTTGTAACMTTGIHMLQSTTDTVRPSTMYRTADTLEKAAINPAVRNAPHNSTRTIQAEKVRETDGHHEGIPRNPQAHFSVEHVLNRREAHGQTQHHGEAQPPQLGMFQHRQAWEWLLKKVGLQIRKARQTSSWRMGSMPTTLR